MYHLFVSGNNEAWQGEPWTIELGRCVREYTAPPITERYGAFTEKQIEEFRRFPCIFAYESGWKQDPMFGLVKDVIARQGKVRIEYEIVPVANFLTAKLLESLSFDLDIGEWEMNRTHWAIKDVDLAKVLHSNGVSLPGWARGQAYSVDITKHQFDVALSFPGEARKYVAEVARALESELGPSKYFYDNNFKAQLARPSLDVLLQEIYGHRSKLVVVFIGSDYQQKDWCGIEFRAIREIIQQRGYERIMFIRMDDGAVDGVFKHDGYIDARTHSPAEIAKFICERAQFAAPI